MLIYSSYILVHCDDELIIFPIAYFFQMSSNSLTYICFVYVLLCLAPSPPRFTHMLYLTHHALNMVDDLACYTFFLLYLQHCVMPSCFVWELGLTIPVLLIMAKIKYLLSHLFLHSKLTCCRSCVFIFNLVDGFCCADQTSSSSGLGKSGLMS